MKTQGAVLKQCISQPIWFGLILLFSTEAFGFSAQSPWLNQVGPEQGFRLGPSVGFDSSDTHATDLRLSADAALSPNSNLFGRYSSQFDQRFGFNQKFELYETNAIYLQAEGSLEKNSTLGWDGGLFDRLNLGFLGLKHFEFEAGLGLHYLPSNEVSTVPFSFGILTASFKPGFQYGVFARGESSPSESTTALSAQVLVAYETEKQVRYELLASLPVSETDAKNETAIRFGVSFLLGTGQGSPSEYLPNPRHFINSEISENRHYNLDANITSLNDALFLIKINKGTSDSVAKGQTFDIYSGETLMARAQVTSVKLEEAVLTVLEYRQEQWIELGFSARRLLE